MKGLSVLVGIMAALVATGASAQSVNLSGVWRCVQGCRGDLPAYVTQNGGQLNLVTEAGVPSRAWRDWSAPANRIWIDELDESAVYTPNGMAIQFDNGTLWVRDLRARPPRPRK
jgi:hypothetical protein